MIKEFWEEKKYSIQLVGILTAIGALFLSIPIPENESARIALFNIQLIWLIIITICVIFLFINLYLLSQKFEKDRSEKYKIDLTETISILILIAIVWVIINLWQYVFAIYKDSLINFIKSISYFFGISTGVAVLFLLKKAESRLFKKQINKKTFLFIYCVTCGALLGFLLTFLNNFNFISNFLIILGTLIALYISDVSFFNKNN